MCLKPKTIIVDQQHKRSVVSSQKEDTTSMLWTIHGELYDLSEFVDRHPGGKESILLGRGRDCTAMFESYHPFTNRHRDILKKYESIGPHKNTAMHVDEFYETLKIRVMKNLKEHNIDPVKDRTASRTRSLYYMCILFMLFVTGSFHVKGHMLGSFAFAIFGWLVGCIGHDAGHFAASRISILNDIGLWGISLLCNPIMWQHQHTFAHHSHTNDFDKDPDLHHFVTFLRVHRKFQHDTLYEKQKNPFYVMFAYAFVVIGECLSIPIGMLQTGLLHGIIEWTDKKRPMRALGFYFHYIAYFSLVFLSPKFYGRSMFHSFACGLIHIVTTGWLFAVFSQINHLNEFSIESHRGETSEKILKSSWAARQVATSNNFATKSRFWHIFSNGLNMQIEHHLFPGLNHCHLHIIQPVVQKTCTEYGVHYKSFDTWSDVFTATLNWLNQLSSAE